MSTGESERRDEVVESERILSLGQPSYAGILNIGERPYMFPRAIGLATPLRTACCARQRPPRIAGLSTRVNGDDILAFRNSG